MAQLRLWTEEPDFTLPERAWLLRWLDVALNNWPVAMAGIAITKQQVQEMRRKLAGGRLP